MTSTSACSKCGTALIAGAHFCYMCGTQVDIKTQTNKLEVASLTSELAVTGSPSFPGSLVLKYEGATIWVLETSKIPLEGVVIGRSGDRTHPDIDLARFCTPDQAQYISRKHAVIHRSKEDGLTITDLGSSNGTFKNGTQLGRNVAYVLYDTDVLVLGKMTLEVYSS